MNRTNWAHVTWALAIQAGFTLIGALLGTLFGALALGAAIGALAGASAAGAFFIGREHAQEQVDIHIRTGVPIVQQNPMDGFLWDDPDRIYDALLPLPFISAVTCFWGAVWLLA